ncbi:hypothetical protein DPX16_19197 [Anabarilius grahami]|uniref:Uncharacterized protein n=1 Tax=Anabarilius grahami TaxID=495550 RepID=A0A3N0Z188_ANAGA|nr:hypothetical protein DPX16_19197 [Anabarilius grahami]
MAGCRSRPVVVAAPTGEGHAERQTEGAEKEELMVARSVMSEDIAGYGRGLPVPMGPQWGPTGTSTRRSSSRSRKREGRWSCAGLFRVWEKSHLGLT